MPCNQRPWRTGVQNNEESFATMEAEMADIALPVKEM
jgi:hypothetical protein